MDEFSELQTLWRNQETAAGPQIEDFVRDLRAHSRKHVTIYTVKAALVLVLTAFILIVVRESALALAGALLTVLGGGIILAMDWRAHAAVGRLEFTASASGFARSAAETLRHLEKPRAAQYALLLAGPVAGLNLMELHFLHGLGWELRLAAHAGYTLFALAAAWGGFRVRARRYERETRPLLSRLEAFSSSCAEPAPRIW